MGRAKRLRKSRMLARRRRVEAKLLSFTRIDVEALRAKYLDALERTMLRGRILATEGMPEPVKRVLGMLADPLGFLQDYLKREELAAAALEPEQVDLIYIDVLKNGTDEGIDVRCVHCGRAWWKNETPCHRNDCPKFVEAGFVQP